VIFRVPPPEFVQSQNSGIATKNSYQVMQADSEEPS